MADSSSRSFLGGDKRIPSGSFYGYLFSGIAVDILAFWLPGAGDVYIAFCRGLYWLNGYKTDKMAMATWINAAVEAVPLLSAFPSATAFAIWTYTINVAETSEAGSVVAGGTLAVNARKEFGVAKEEGRQKGTQDQRKNGNQQTNKDTAGKERTPLNNNATASMSRADKIGGYATSARNTVRGNNSGIDGVRRPDSLPTTSSPLPHTPHVGEGEGSESERENPESPRGTDDIRDYRDTA